MNMKLVLWNVLIIATSGLHAAISFYFFPEWASAHYTWAWGVFTSPGSLGLQAMAAIAIAGWQYRQRREEHRDWLKLQFEHPIS